MRKFAILLVVVFACALLAKESAAALPLIVVAWDVVEHVPDPRAFVDRLRSWLVPGGTLALSLPNVDSWPAKVLRERWWTLRPTEHIWHFTPRTLARTLHEAGFTHVALTANPLAPGNLGRLDSMLAMATAPDEGDHASR